MTISPIQTFYDGYFFKSRAEARWAVFFNTLRIPYEYEREGYRLPSGQFYLPDFWLPNQDCWLEVKPQYPTDKEIAKLALVGEGSNKRAFITFGMMPYPPDPNGYDNSYGFMIQVAPCWDNFYIFCECPECHVIDIEYSGRSVKHKSNCHIRELPTVHPDKIYNFDTPLFRQATFEARNYKF